MEAALRVKTLKDESDVADLVREITFKVPLSTMTKLLKANRGYLLEIMNEASQNGTI
jgi:inorganic triphosphatase YgiF